MINLGYLEIGLSLLILIQLPYFSYSASILLGSLCLITSLVIFNPLISQPTQYLQLFQLQSFLYDLMLAGCAFAIASI